MKQHKIAKKMSVLLTAKTWREYCGFNALDLKKKMEKTLSCLDIPYTILEAPTSSAENMMLGAGNSSMVFKTASPAKITIKIVQVTGDPFLRLFAKVLSDNVLLQSSSVIEIFPLNDQTKPLIRAFLKNLIEQSERKPWEFSDLRFQNAVLLRLKIKKSWKRWIA